MTRCNSFYRKWKQEPNFCGVGKSAAKEIEKYFEFVEDFTSKYAIDEDIVYLNVPATSVKTLVRFKKDSEIRTKAMNLIASALKAKRAVSRKIVDSFLQMNPVIIPLKESDRTKMEVTSSSLIFESKATSDISQKNRVLLSILSSGQIQILQDYMSGENLDNEYAALCNILSKIKDVMNKTPEVTNAKI